MRSNKKNVTGKLEQHSLYQIIALDNEGCNRKIVQQKGTGLRSAIGIRFTASIIPIMTWLKGRQKSASRDSAFAFPEKLAQYGRRSIPKQHITNKHKNIRLLFRPRWKIRV